MPPLLTELSSRVDQNITTIVDLVLASSSNPSTSDPVQVICAWPVSGQYGPGTRILYYALIAACLLARKADWLVNACLAAALLLPAIAAIHGIVLTALHVHDAVDMDIFGAFQLCSIGILAAPVTVMMSRTYFNDPGRNTIFLWVLLILAGMLCLAVEFYRIETFDCTHSDSGSLISSDVSKFPLGNESICGLPFRCSTQNGPISPIRGGAADNVYIIPAPGHLTFGTATLLAAACCVHAVLCLVSMWDRILDINWRRASRTQSRETEGNLPGSGKRDSDDATQALEKGINGKITYFLKIIAIPIFGGVGLAILILGEINFYSRQVQYQTEPLASVGQWGPICGTFLAMVGSLYILVAKKVQDVTGQSHPNASGAGCACTHHGCCSSSPAETRVSLDSSPVSCRSRRSDVSDSRASGTEAENKDAGYRQRFATFLITAGEWLGTPRDFDGSEFNHGVARNYPEVPGERGRNPVLRLIIDSYADRSRTNSAAGSIVPSEAYDAEAKYVSRSQRSASPGSWSSEGQQNGDMERDRRLMELQFVQGDHSPPTGGQAGHRSQPRRRTLEVPSPVHLSPGRSISISTITSNHRTNND
ncbi:hypothetical protein B0T10DRAFT_490769 [Thelonectria olida]|uniref:Uncharacterized protein n=1 Tax=Thelonectria olida TaxID=1576542 RepID=A0A9P9AJS3_9HYPO|nr:hypothetical protein B0T10DRAFT_490769 [Thelonectria olida]